MIIGLDFDGVICDSLAAKVACAKERFGVDIKEGEFKKELVIGAGILTLGQYREVQKEVYGTQKWVSEYIPVKDSIEYIKHAHVLGDTIVIITSRATENERACVKEFLRRYNLEEIEIISVPYGTTKKQACINKKCDVFVDDDLEKLIDLQGAVDRIYLFSWDYNSYEVLPVAIQRIGSLVDIERKTI